MLNKKKKIKNKKNTHKHEFPPIFYKEKPNNFFCLKFKDGKLF